MDTVNVIYAGEMPVIDIVTDTQNAKQVPIENKDADVTKISLKIKETVHEDEPQSSDRSESGTLKSKSKKKDKRSKDSNKLTKDLNPKFETMLKEEREKLDEYITTETKEVITYSTIEYKIPYIDETVKIDQPVDQNKDKIDLKEEIKKEQKPEEQKKEKKEKTSKKEEPKKDENKKQEEKKEEQNKEQADKHKDTYSEVLQFGEKYDQKQLHPDEKNEYKSIWDSFLGTFTKEKSPHEDDFQNKQKMSTELAPQNWQADLIDEIVQLKCLQTDIGSSNQMICDQLEEIICFLNDHKHVTDDKLSDLDRNKVELFVSTSKEVRYLVKRTIATLKKDLLESYMIIKAKWEKAMSELEKLGVRTTHIHTHTYRYV